MPAIPGPMKVYGNSLRVMRIVRGLSQQKLGELAGVKAARLWKIEHEVVKPREEEVARLLGVLTTDGSR